MAIKKFGAPDPENTPSVPTPKDAARNSKFSAFLSKEDPKKKPLGNKVYSAGSTTSGKYERDDDLMEALLIRAEDAFKEAEKLVGLYDRAVRNPTRANVNAYSEGISEIIDGDAETAKAVLSVVVATLVSTLNQGRPGR